MITNIPDPTLPDWIKLLNTYDPTHYTPGKLVTAEEWNTLFLAGVNQGNYLANTMDLLIKEYLPETFVTKVDHTSQIEIIDSILRGLQSTDINLQTQITSLQNNTTETLNLAQAAKAFATESLEKAEEANNYAKNAHTIASEAEATAEEALSYLTENIVKTVNGKTGFVTLNSTDLPDSADLVRQDQIEEVNLELDQLGTASTKDVGTAAGQIPILDNNGKLAESTLPALALTDTYEASSETAMLALSAQQGDVCIRTDLNKSFVLRRTPASTLSNWIELRTPTDTVLSVNGKIGAVQLASTDLTDTDKLARLTDVDSKIETAIGTSEESVTEMLKNYVTLDTDQVIKATKQFLFGDEEDFTKPLHRLTIGQVNDYWAGIGMSLKTNGAFQGAITISPYHGVIFEGKDYARPKVYTGANSTADILTTADLVSNLNTETSSKALSANQGKILNEKKVDVEDFTLLQNRVTTTETNITTLGNTKADQTALNSTNSVVAENRSAIDGLNTALTGLTTRVSDSETNISELQDNKADKEALNSLTNRVSTNEEAIDNLQTDKASATLVNNIQTRVGTAELNIINLQNDKADKTALEAANTNISANTQDITALQTSLNTVSTSITNLQNNKADKTSLETTNTAVDENTQNINNLQTALDTAETNITTLQNTKADKTELPTKVSELDNDANYLSSIPAEYVTEAELTVKNYDTVSSVNTKVSNNLTSAKSYTDEKVAALINSAPETLDTLAEVAKAIQDNETVVDALNDAIGTKADKTALNTLDTRVTTVENTLTTKADKTEIPTALEQLTEDSTHRLVTDAEKTTWNAKVSQTALNALDTRVTTTETTLTTKANKTEIPTALSQLTDDASHRLVSDTEKTTWNAKLDNYTETDPTVPAWAKAATKPQYDYSEILNTPVIPEGTQLYGTTGQNTDGTMTQKATTDALNLKANTSDIDFDAIDFAEEERRKVDYNLFDLYYNGTDTFKSVTQLSKHLKIQQDDGGSTYQMTISTVLTDEGPVYTFDCSKFAGANRAATLTNLKPNTAYLLCFTVDSTNAEQSSFMVNSLSGDNASISEGDYVRQFTTDSNGEYYFRYGIRLVGKTTYTISHIQLIEAKWQHYEYEKYYGPVVHESALRNLYQLDYAQTINIGVTTTTYSYTNTLNIPVWINFQCQILYTTLFVYVDDVLVDFCRHFSAERWSANTSLILNPGATVRFEGQNFQDYTNANLFIIPFKENM